MQIRIVNNQINNPYSQKKQPSFQAKTTNPVEIIKKMYAAIDDEKMQDPKKLKAIMKEGLELITENSPLAKRGRFEFAFNAQKNALSEKLNSNDLEMQKIVINRVFDLKELSDSVNSNKVNEYIEKTIAPFIKETKNKELASYVLSKTFEKVPNRSVSSINLRIKLLNKIGSERNIYELQTYSDNSGIPKEIRENSLYQGDLKKIEKAAQKTIEKLSTYPPF